MLKSFIIQEDGYSGTQPCMQLDLIKVAQLGSLLPMYMAVYIVTAAKTAMDSLVYIIAWDHADILPDLSMEHVVQTDFIFIVKSL